MQYICDACGAELKKTDKYCTLCGAKVKKDIDKDNNESIEINTNEIDTNEEEQSENE